MYLALKRVTTSQERPYEPQHSCQGHRFQGTSRQV